MAGFSSQGPTHGDLLIKPDVVAPGADIVSSFPRITAIARRRGLLGVPRRHVDGHAAPRRRRRGRAWRSIRTGRAAQVRSAVVNTAQQGLLRHPETGVVTDDALIVGAGLRRRRGGGGRGRGARPGQQVVRQPLERVGRQSRARPCVITNISGVSKTFTVSVSDTANDGVAFATNGGTVTLAAGASATFNVAAGAPEDGRGGTIPRTSSGDEGERARAGRAATEGRHPDLDEASGASRWPRLHVRVRAASTARSPDRSEPVPGMSRRAAAPARA